MKCGVCHKIFFDNADGFTEFVFHKIASHNETTFSNKELDD